MKNLIQKHLTEPLAPPMFSSKCCLQPPFRGNFLDPRRVKDQLSKKQVWSPIPLDNVGTTGTLNAPFQTLGSLYEHGPLGIVLYTIS